jgi:hypothetical protein
MVRVKDFQGPVVGISEKTGWGPPIQTNMSKMRCPHMTTCPATETSMGSSRYTYIYICIYIYTYIYIYMIMKYSQYVCMILYDYQIYQNLIEIGSPVFLSALAGVVLLPSLHWCPAWPLTLLGLLFVHVLIVHLASPERRDAEPLK